MDAGSRATFAFTGTQVSWIGYRDEWSGIGRVYIDGALKGEVDTYTAGNQSKTVLYTATGLSFGTHTIIVEAAGQRSASSKANWIWVDAFDYSGSAAATTPSGGTNTGAATGTNDNLQIGYAVIRSASGAVSPNAAAVLGFRQNGVLVSESVVPPSRSIVKGHVFAEANAATSTGFAVANSSDSAASLDFVFTDLEGRDYGAGNLTVPAHGQISRYLNEAPFNAPASYAGTF